jgi:hypothetical protein
MTRRPQTRRPTVKVRVVIVVSGGNVQHCYADDQNVEVEVIDFDNLREEGPAVREEAEKLLGVCAAQFQHVY